MILYLYDSDGVKNLDGTICKEKKLYKLISGEKNPWKKKRPKIFVVLIKINQYQCLVKKKKTNKPKTPIEYLMLNVRDAQYTKQREIQIPKESEVIYLGFI